MRMTARRCVGRLISASPAAWFAGTMVGAMRGGENRWPSLRSTVPVAGDSIVSSRGGQRPYWLRGVDAYRRSDKRLGARTTETRSRPRGDVPCVAS
jgi:hypothetical protein